jgi:hypothetical protein
MLKSKILGTIYNATACLAGLGAVALLSVGCAGPALRTSFID